jgi:hypothetical protein
VHRKRTIEGRNYQICGGVKADLAVFSEEKVFGRALPVTYSLKACAAVGTNCQNNSVFRFTSMLP